MLFIIINSNAFLLCNLMLLSFINVIINLNTFNASGMQIKMRRLQQLYIMQEIRSNRKKERERVRKRELEIRVKKRNNRRERERKFNILWWR